MGETCIHVRSLCLSNSFFFPAFPCFHKPVPHRIATFPQSIMFVHPFSNDHYHKSMISLPRGGLIVTSISLKRWVACYMYLSILQDLSHCTGTGFKTLENKHKELVFKELRKLWEKHDANLPWGKGCYNASNTLLLDDSPYKALLNPVS